MFLRIIKNKRVIIPLFVLLFVLVGLAVKKWKAKPDSLNKPQIEQKQESKNEFDILDTVLSLFGKEKVLPEPNTGSESESEVVSDTKEKIEEDEESANSEEDTSKETNKVNDAPPVLLHDVYAKEDTEVRFYIFDPNDTSYTWEVYDAGINDWTPADNVKMQKDNLGRSLYYLAIQATRDNDNTMIRCLHGDKEETAFLHVLTKEIVDIEPLKEKADINTYLTSFDYPVKVTYSDSSTEEISGLWGLFFGYSKSERTTEYDEFGMLMETVTTKTTESYYHKVYLEKEQLSIRYHQSDESVISKEIELQGTDEMAPSIDTVAFNDYKISQSEKEEVPVTVTIKAIDNVTPLPSLQYAFVPVGTKEIKEEAWQNSPSFVVTVSKNGRYAACVRDSANNVSKLERDIIVADTKPPLIHSVSLGTEEGWAQKNTISVEAEDGTAMTYCFNNIETGDTSGFIDKNEYDAKSNGKWNIQVRDRAGNISESEIVVSNIDNHAPVIKIISEVK